MSDFDGNSLDPGIRDLVVALRADGWNTTDSGDGYSKPEDERVFDVPHVAISLRDIAFPSELAEHADRLHAWLQNRGYGQFSVEATYWPANGAMILLATSPSETGVR